MEQLLSGLYGALIASILSIIYLYFSGQIRLRSELMLEVVAYCDDIYHRLSEMHVHKDRTYSEKKRGLTDDEYRKYSQDLSAFLKSSKIRAKIALVYGEGQVLGIYNELFASFLEVSSVLRSATRAAWLVKEKKEVDGIFSNKIEPLRYQLEKSLLEYARVSGVTRTLALRHCPTFMRILKSACKK